MKLRVIERAIALSLLPEQGDFSTLKIIQEAKLNLALKESEIEEFAFKIEEGQMKWNLKGEEEREIELSKTAIQLIAEKLLDLDAKKELKPAQLSTYEKFVVKE
jgi:hypothetical protein